MIYTHMDFRQWLEEEEKGWWVVEIARAEAYSSGFHGFGDVPEQPADDCNKRAKWNLPFLSWPSEIEQLLRQGKVCPYDSSFHSYHECSVSFRVEVHIQNEKVAGELETLLKPFESETEGEAIWKAGKWDKECGAGFPFTNYREAVLKSIQLKNKNLKPPKELGGGQTLERPRAPRPGESSADHWARLWSNAEREENWRKRLDPRTREGD